MAQICTWTGQTGAPYSFGVYELSRTWQEQQTLFTNELPAIYIFSRLETNGHVPIYIGQTSDISTRFYNHHELEDIKRSGPTHIHLHVNHNGEYARLSEERDLIGNYKPVLNDNALFTNRIDEPQFN